jgi:hypothetical protein
LHRWLVAAAKYYLNNYNLERMEYKIFWQHLHPYKLETHVFLKRGVALSCPLISCDTERTPCLQKARWHHFIFISNPREALLSQWTCLISLWNYFQISFLWILLNDACWASIDDLLFPLLNDISFSHWYADSSV